MSTFADTMPPRWSVLVTGRRKATLVRFVVLHCVFCSRTGGDTIARLTKPAPTNISAATDVEKQLWRLAVDCRIGEPLRRLSPRCPQDGLQGPATLRLCGSDQNCPRLGVGQRQALVPGRRRRHALDTTTSSPEFREDEVTQTAPFHAGDEECRANRGGC